MTLTPSDSDGDNDTRTVERDHAYLLVVQFSTISTLVVTASPCASNSGSSTVGDTITLDFSLEGITCPP